MQQAQVIPLQRADRQRRTLTAPVRPPASPARPREPDALVEPTPLHPRREPVPDTSARSRLADVVGFLRRRITGDYPVDEFGFDPELTDSVLLPPLRLLLRHASPEGSTVDTVIASLIGRQAPRGPAR